MVPAFNALEKHFELFNFFTVRVLIEEQERTAQRQEGKIRKSSFPGLICPLLMKCRTLLKVIRRQNGGG